MVSKIRAYIGDGVPPGLQMRCYIHVLDAINYMAAVPGHGREKNYNYNDLRLPSTVIVRLASVWVLVVLQLA